MNLRCGIIGCGVIAPSHIESFNKHAQSEVTWLCDINEDRLHAMGDRYGIAHRAGTVSQLLAAEDLDAVSVCTDHASHAEVVEQCLAAGKHVLCEKPLGAHVENLERMQAARDRYPGPVFSGVFQHRFDPLYAATRKCIQDGLFGTLLNIDLVFSCHRTRAYYTPGGWRGTWAQEGGSLMINQAIHYLDLLDWMSGGIDAVSARWRNLDHAGVIETEDTLSAALSYANGALGAVSATSASNLNWHQVIWIRGTKGALELREGKVFTVSFKEAADADRVNRALEPGGEDEQFREGKAYYGPSHPTQIADFISAILEQREPFVTAESSARTVRIVKALYEAHDKQAWVQIP